MRNLFRALFSPPGLDRALARTELFEPGGLHSLSMTIHYPCGGRPGHWWADAAFRSLNPKSVGLPTLPVARRTPYERDEEVQQVWDWMQATAAARRLPRPRLDERAWAMNTLFEGEAGLTARLAELRAALGREPVSLSAVAWGGERGDPDTVHLSASFPARAGSDRPAIGVIYIDLDTPALRALVADWTRRTAALLSIPFDCSI